jgi:hypothetical protein
MPMYLQLSLPKILFIEFNAALYKKFDVFLLECLPAMVFFLILDNIIHDKLPNRVSWITFTGSALRREDGWIQI